MPSGGNLFIRNYPWIVIGINSFVSLLVDFTSFYFLRKRFPFKSFLYTYWILSLLILLSISCVFLDFEGSYLPEKILLYSYVFAIYLASFSSKFLYLTSTLISKAIFAFNRLVVTESEQTISRRSFIEQLALGIAFIPLASTLYATTFGRSNFQVLKRTIKIKGLGKEFKGFKIVQFSDLHLGGFGRNSNEIQKGIDMMNSLEPDIVVFTGDMVNNYSSETDGYAELLGSINHKYGKFSVLGNHDYGEYTPWESEELKQNDHQRLINFHKQSGFQLLRNESAIININDSPLNIIGVENYGKAPQPQWGNLDLAVHNVDTSQTCILLSHDPYHWDTIVMHRDEIDLTLSGHTHGMQLGVEIGNYKWSPIKYKYPHWADLYQHNGRYLYVNRGFGTIGFPGRFGIRPEITLLTLESL